MVFRGVATVLGVGSQDVSEVAVNDVAAIIQDAQGRLTGEDAREKDVVLLAVAVDRETAVSIARLLYEQLDVRMVPR